MILVDKNMVSMIEPHTEDVNVEHVRELPSPMIPHYYFSFRNIVPWLVAKRMLMAISVVVPLHTMLLSVKRSPILS